MHRNIPLGFPIQYQFFVKQFIVFSGPTADFGGSDDEGRRVIADDWHV